MQDDEEEARSVVDRHRKVLRQWVGTHGGRILQFYGDGTLSVFPSAVSAVEAAVEVQKELTTQPAIPLRIGIHTATGKYFDNGWVRTAAGSSSFTATAH